VIPAEVWLAPAKLNLFLHVVGRRADGFHLLQTVFQFLDYADELRFTVREDGNIQRHGGLAEVPAEQDLVVRAARLLQEQTGCHQGADIHLEKRLPAGGGIGGGSSDAATTLVALDRLWDLQLGTDRLTELGLSLGADVPVFVRGQAAWAEGVGEQLQPVELPEPWFLVVHPGVHVATPEIFQAPELTRDHAPITIRDFLAGAGENDCEPVVRARHPQVAQALDWLKDFGQARMTGTGACVFTSFSSQAAAAAALSQLPGHWRGFVARGCNRSPLYR